MSEAIVRQARLIVEPRPTDFTEHRRSMIGGTDIAPILGISEKKTRFTVWAEKMGQSDFNPEDELAEAGLYLEPYVLGQFAKRLGVVVKPCTVTYRLRERPFLAVNPDGFVFRAGDALLGVVDAKTRSPYVRGLWGAPGSADVPPDELCQIQYYQEILDINLGYFAVLFDRFLVPFVVPRDREFGALMLEEATAFWNDHVLTKEPPAFQGLSADRFLARKYAAITEPTREASPTDDILVAQRELIRRHQAVLQERLDAVEGALKERIGAAPAIAGEGYMARWYGKKGATRTDWRAVITDLRSFPVTADEETAAAIQRAIDGAIARYTTTSEPTRVLKVSFKGPRRLPPVELEPINPELAALPPAEENE